MVYMASHYGMISSSVIPLQKKFNFSIMMLMMMMMVIIIIIIIIIWLLKSKSPGSLTTYLYYPQSSQRTEWSQKAF